MNIIVTERAAAEVKHILAGEGFKPEEKVYLRLRIVGGGCSGFQHKLDLTPDVTDKDDFFEITGVNVVVDKRSQMYIDGVIIDFHDDLNKRGFSVQNPNARTTCGCGSSFSM